MYTLGDYVINQIRANTLVILNILPLRHDCNCSKAMCCCDIPISQIGHRFHYIPKLFMDTVFFPPSVPAWVLCHIKANPPTWTWTLRAGPRAGTTLTVLMIPIHCSGDSHKAVQWLVSIFHLFKVSLNSRVCFMTDGRVIPELAHMYQNNMLLHVAVQM